MSHHGPNPFEPPVNMSDEDKKRLLMNTTRAELKPFQRQEGESEEQARDRLRRELLNTTGFLGALGTHPEGKLTKDDEGAIQFRVGSEGDKVVVDFGTQVQWVGMDAKQAAELASSLMKWARYVARRNGETVTLDLGAL